MTRGSAAQKLRRTKFGWIIGLLLGAVTWLCMWLLLIVGQLGAPHKDNVWLKGAYSVKQKAIGAIESGPKILVVGGSATMFGADSQELKKLTGLPTINFGVNAGIGTYALPAMADPFISPGDVIVMPLEYMLLLWDGRPSYVTLSWTLEHPEFLKRWQLTPAVLGLWTLSLTRVYEGYRGIPDGYVNLGTYGPHRLGPTGDQLQSSKDQQTSGQLERLQRLKPTTPLLERLQVTKVGLNEWAYWWGRWRARGACLMIVPPPFMKHAVYDETEWQAFFKAIPHRVNAVGGHYMGKPQQAFFALSDMFDTAYHLNAEARVQYTRWLAKFILSRERSCT